MELIPESSLTEPDQGRATMGLSEEEVGIVLLSITAKGGVSATPEDVAAAAAGGDKLHAGREAVAYRGETSDSKDRKTNQHGNVLEL